MRKLKNYLLLSTVVLSQLHTLFRGSKTRVDWYLLIDYTRRIDYAVMYTTTAVNFFILALCLKFPEGVKKEIINFIFIVTCLDLFHYFLVSKLYFGLVKIFVAVFIWLFIYVFNNFSRVKNKIYNTIRQWIA